MNNQNAPGAESVTRLGGDIRASLPAQTGRGQSMTPLAAAIVAVLYPAAMTLAQGASPAAGQLEEIVVTATRRDVNLQNVAQSVTHFPAVTPSSCVVCRRGRPNTALTARCRCTWTISP